MEHAKALAQQQQQQQFMIPREQQNQQQQHAISNFPSNSDAHRRPPQINTSFIQSHNRSNPNPNLNLQHFQQQQAGNANRLSPANQAELQMAYRDAWLVCHPDFKRPFVSLEDASERLLPYHVVADYEGQEEDRILDTDTTGKILSRSQQWDRNIAAKVAEFTATFEKQVIAFNMISHKLKHGEFKSEERLMVNQAYLQEERRALLEAKARGSCS